MKNKHPTAKFGALTCVLTLALGAQAQQAPAPQPSQTAEGAQRFLSTLVRKGNGYAWFVDAQNRTNYVRGKAVRTTTHIGVMGNDETKSERVIEKQLGAFTVSSIDSQGPDGKPDACLTRIAKWETKEQFVENKSWQTTDEGILIDTPILHNENSTYELTPELVGPHWIDWRNVKLARSTNGAQMTASFKAKNFTAHLSFTGETELVDRVEYAMKFLKMSCDDTTATGF
ncbi:hypothetical protein [Roseateles asaccharophilus]|uniref:Uncharacterized protein n=1 Tax=Roseateles asaccharophilus TaxID=582607 RepID=A0ABU2A5A3_9BURK|nr:hypothetical protein [Roseateles asaccharophilus]MDR7332378.1 hypothetical protein [Roseateles asaccharophilus]